MLFGALALTAYILSPFLQTLIFAVVLDGYDKTAGGLLAACDRPGVVSIVSVVTAVVNVGLCLALIPPLGLTGAALANAGGWVLGAAALVVLAAREARRPVLEMVDLGFLLRLVGACAVLALAVAPLRGTGAALLWQALAAVPALAIGLLLFRPLSRADLGTVERALAAAGVRSERLRRVVRAAHSRISHGPLAGQGASRS